MIPLNQALKSTPVVYVTRDIERALGLPLDTEGYFIISNSSPFAKDVAKNNKNVLLVAEDEQLDTWQLLQREETKNFINNLTNPKILVFKNTKQIEKICAEQSWNLLNPPSTISEKVEPKISQITWLGDLAKYLPNYTVLECKNIKWEEKPFILQFNRSHTGSGTMLIKSEEHLNEVKQKFPNREARIADYIEGPLFTNNNCVQKNKILIGNISYQITGLKPFTDRSFATIGNDWKLPTTLLTDEQRKRYVEIATKVGEKLRKEGWQGLFGIDTITNSKTGELFLLEINCRQPASTTFESLLQRTTNNEQLTIFEAHLYALLNIENTGSELTKINDGAQIIQRILESGQKTMDSKLLREKNFSVIEYNNKKPGSDLIRIQSKKGIKSDHNKFNEVGNKILNLLN